MQTRLNDLSLIATGGNLLLLQRRPCRLPAHVPRTLDLILETSDPSFCSHLFAAAVPSPAQQRAADHRQSAAARPAPGITLCNLALCAVLYESFTHSLISQISSKYLVSGF